MPRIIIVPGDAVGEAPTQSPVFDEEVKLIHLDDDHQAEQLIERMVMALADAEETRAAA